MSTEQRVEQLRRKHRELEEALHDARAHPSVSTLEINELKRRKLALKDEISQAV